MGAMRVFGLLVLGMSCGCDKSEAPAAKPAANAEAGAGEKPRKAAAIAHAGVGTPPSMSDGCKAAVDAALRAIERGADPVDAAVEGVVVMEDDPRFNAGTGSRVRLDGETVQMDASVMSSDGRFGAVAGIENVKNPVKVAKAVTQTPHILLSGDGATRFARTLGFAPYDPRTAESRERSRATQAKLLAHDPAIPEAWNQFDWRAQWNFERSLADAGLAEGGTHSTASDAGKSLDAGKSSDTVGVAVRAADGRFGVALSTGGTSITLRGRVGDVPILGAGLYAGKHGAIAATGTGERIVEVGLARSVHGWLSVGTNADSAAKKAVDVLRGKDIGIIVITRDGMAAAGDREMAWAARESGAATWLEPH